MAEHKKHIAFKGKILILGFGAVGQGTLPLLLRHIDMPKENVSIITAEDWVERSPKNMESRSAWSRLRLRTIFGY